MGSRIIRGDARSLPLADDCVDLIVTSPPYWALRSYRDGGEHYDGQIGAEPTPEEYIDNLIICTREWMRALKPCGSLWINLGDKYNASSSGSSQSGPKKGPQQTAGLYSPKRALESIRPKSLLGLPWRYALRCIDDLGLILRAEIIWSKPNGLPESVTDRVRRSHEHWFHFTIEPRYYSAVDEIREPASEYVRPNGTGRQPRGGQRPRLMLDTCNPLGKLPGSVWEVATQPLRVPEHLGVDHFAAFPIAFPRRIITAWSPAGICTECGEGRRPSFEPDAEYLELRAAAQGDRELAAGQRAQQGHNWGWGAAGNKAIQNLKNGGVKGQITAYRCACPEPSAPTKPAVVLDPFAGTGTTVLVADVLGRHGIGVDMSADYCRLAQWRVSDPAERARVLGVPKPPPVPADTAPLFDLEA